jgi:hypothetical protein
MKPDGTSFAPAYNLRLSARGKAHIIVSTSSFDTEYQNPALLKHHKELSIYSSRPEARRDAGPYYRHPQHHPLRK